jgi:AraC-like DNA-binding protein
MYFMRMSSKTYSCEIGRSITSDRFFVEFDHRRLSNITHIGRQRFTHAKEPLGNHTHKEAMEICFLDAGEQVFSVAGRMYHLKGGEVFVTYPDEVHSSKLYPMEKSTLYWIAINLVTPRCHFLGYCEPQAELLRKRLLNLKPRMFKASMRLRDKFDQALDIYHNKNKLWTLFFRNYVFEILWEVCTCAQGKHARTLTPLMRDVLEQIDRRAETHLTLSELAGFAKLSMPRFKARFKAETGIAPHEYILRKKIERAKSLMQGGRTGIAAVARTLSFPSSQYFATVFRRFTGTTPKAFLKTA